MFEGERQWKAVVRKAKAVLAPTISIGKMPLMTHLRKRLGPRILYGSGLPKGCTRSETVKPTRSEECKTSGNG